MRTELYPIQPFFVASAAKYYKKIVLDAQYVHFYAFTADAAGAEFSAVVPAGCADMLFTFGRGLADGRLLGFVTQSASLDLPRGAHCFGVRFRPGCLPARLDACLPEIVNARVPLGDMRGGGGLAERVAEAGGFLERVELLRDFIGERWRCSGLLRQLIAVVEGCGGAIRVSELEDRTMYSARYINRVFSDNLGLSPKAFAEHARFQRLIGMMNGAGLAGRPGSSGGLGSSGDFGCPGDSGRPSSSGGPGNPSDFGRTGDSGTPCSPRRPSLAELAAAAGYYDQSHMANEFKQFAAMTPREYLGVVDVEHYSQKLICV
ncbi:MAG: helix-turn-helix domain-containing protein [Clostridiales bacterium]|jgi:AraC-like DNA-binding protein|nr:helix-turn-helix domain-containing protein [Clostridiales bacterium]